MTLNRVLKCKKYDTRKKDTTEEEKKKSPNTKMSLQKRIKVAGDQEDPIDHSIDIEAQGRRQVQAHRSYEKPIPMWLKIGGGAAALAALMFGTATMTSSMVLREADFLMQSHSSGVSAQSRGSLLPPALNHVGKLVSKPFRMLMDLTSRSLAKIQVSKDKTVWLIYKNPKTEITLSMECRFLQMSPDAKTIELQSKAGGKSRKFSLLNVVWPEMPLVVIPDQPDLQKPNFQDIQEHTLDGYDAAAKKFRIVEVPTKCSSLRSDPEVQFTHTEHFLQSQLRQCSALVDPGFIQRFANGGFQPLLLAEGQVDPFNMSDQARLATTMKAVQDLKAAFAELKSGNGPKAAAPVKPSS